MATITMDTIDIISCVTFLRKGLKKDLITVDFINNLGGKEKVKENYSKLLKLITKSSPPKPYDKITWTVDESEVDQIINFVNSVNNYIATSPVLRGEITSDAYRLYKSYSDYANYSSNHKITHRYIISGTVGATVLSLISVTALISIYENKLPTNIHNFFSMDLLAKISKFPIVDKLLISSAITIPFIAAIVVIASPLIKNMLVKDALKREFRIFKERYNPVKFDKLINRYLTNDNDYIYYSRNINHNYYTTIKKVKDGFFLAPIVPFWIGRIKELGPDHAKIAEVAGLKNISDSIRAYAKKFIIEHGVEDKNEITESVIFNDILNEIEKICTESKNNDFNFVAYDKHNYLINNLPKLIRTAIHNVKYSEKYSSIQKIHQKPTHKLGNTIQKAIELFN